jgi:hypothetical protein
LSSARGEPAAEQLGRMRVDHGDVADAHVLARLLAVGRADVDVQLADLRDLLALLAAQQVDRLLAHDSPDGAVLGLQHDALADEDLRIPAADFGEPQVAVVVDVRDDQADLVDVPHHQQPPRALALGALRACTLCGDQRPRRADRVGRDLGEAARRLAPDGARQLLVTGRAGREQQVAQDRRKPQRVVRGAGFGGVVHRASSVLSTYCRMPP